LVFSEGVTMIIGPNASGKTNLFESLILLSTGKSFKARLEEEMIGYDASITRITGIASNLKLETILTRGKNGWPGKKLTVNGVPKRLIDFAGNFKTVLFGPWDIDLVTGSPSLRRKFLDTVLSQVDREYRRAILSYEKGLRQRNRILWNIRENPSVGSGQGQLLFWNQLLIKNGDYISQKREELINFINSKQDLNETRFEINYDKSVISEGRLREYQEEEIAAATTLVGPHRDDMQFTIYNLQFTKKRDLAGFGSRGEQRMGILWLKLAELSFIEAKSHSEDSGQAGEKPTLLLDDILSELDHEHRKIVVELAKGQQTIITTADEHFIKGFGKKIKLIEL